MININNRRNNPNLKEIETGEVEPQIIVKPSVSPIKELARLNSMDYKKKKTEAIPNLIKELNDNKIIKSHLPEMKTSRRVNMQQYTNYSCSPEIARKFNCLFTDSYRDKPNVQNGNT